MDTKIHLSGLNGIRAIAAIAVVISHTNIGLLEFNLPLIQSWDLAGHGVTMFFALSGFLITYLLILESNKQEINIRKFYLRRILRIWPLYFLYLIVSAVVALFTGFINNQNFSLLFLYIFFLANITQILGYGLVYIGHFWSIGVEEQFYLFWPWLIKKSKGNVTGIVLGFTLLYFTLRLFLRFLEFKWGISWPYLAIQVNRFDCMAIGGIGSILFYKKNALFEYFVYSKFAQIFAWLVLLFISFNKFHVASVLDPEIISVTTVILIVNLCNNSNRLINLDYPVFNFLGKISYGIYVIHPLVIFFYAKFINHFDFQGPLKYALVYSGVLGLTIIISYLSFEFYEKRFIKMKDRYSIVKSSSSKEYSLHTK